MSGSLEILSSNNLYMAERIWTYMQYRQYTPYIIQHGKTQDKEKE